MSEDVPFRRRETRSTSTASTTRRTTRTRSLTRRTSPMYDSRISKALVPSSSSSSPPLSKNWIRSSSSSSCTGSSSFKFGSSSRRHHHNGRSMWWPTHDLWTTELLVWILPTHMLTHIARFSFGLIVLLGGVLVCLLQLEMMTTTMDVTKKDATTTRSMYEHYLLCMWMSFLLLCIFIWIYWYYHSILSFACYGKPWMDPRVTSVHRLDMHVPLRLFESAPQARRAACRPDLVARRLSQQQEQEEEMTPNVLLLDSDEWQFQLLPTVEEGLALVYDDHVGIFDENDDKEDTWRPIQVPGCWMLQGFDDIPIYTNKKYPFPNTPPVVPRQNPTGVYRLQMELPADWRTQDDDDDEAQISLLLHGVESAFFCFWNGEFLGFGKDSRLPSEFLIPPELIVEQQAVLHVVVARWSDGTYLEDQDHWMLGGIHRSVELVCRPRGADILDYHVVSPASGDLVVSVLLRGVPPNRSLDRRRIRATLYDDEQTTANGEWMAKQEVWTWSQPVEEASETTIHLVGTVANPKQWTAETPHLYTLVIEQVDSTTGRVSQAESCRVGFRSIDMEDGILKVNGKRITICGINRHEHDPDHGKVVSMDRMKQDIIVLKENNFNAVRTSHYPTHSSFYKLCDFYGLYVCDEANIETDGMKPMGRLANDWGWERAFVSRVQRMVQRDWNHACIIMWSLGNESGRGRNFVKARETLLDLDTTRPNCYEGGSWTEGVGRTELTDIICPMYPDVATTIKLAEKKDEDRPVILCEYSHSMNNSNGNLHLYWEAFWNPSYPRLQGGFIWDMIDQGLRERTRNGVEYFAYGGDFREPITDFQFCINGMFSPDRQPHPSVYEIKYLQQPVCFEPIGGSVPLEVVVSTNVNPLNPLEKNDAMEPITISAHNRYSFMGLEHLKFGWTLSCDQSSGEVIWDGEAYFDQRNLRLKIDLNKCMKTIRDMESKTDVAFAPKYFLNVCGYLASSCSWTLAGHEVAYEQIPLKFTFRDDPPTRPSSTPELSPREPLEVTTTLDLIQLYQGEDTPSFLTIDRMTGEISAIDFAGMGNNVLNGSNITPCFTRAETDNDRGGMELVLDFLRLNWARSLVSLYAKSGFSYAMHWRDHGVSQDAPPNGYAYTVDVISQTPDLVVIVARGVIRKAQTVLFEQTVTYTVDSERRIGIRYNIVPMPSLRSIPSLPRVGVRFRLSRSIDSLVYFGRGPWENYPDRKASSKLGVWRLRPDEMGYDYIVPSETGSRSDCEWVAFQGNNDDGIIIASESNSSFSFSALLHSAEELHWAKHTSDLDPRCPGVHPVFVHIDYKMMGLGGDVSWFPCVYSQYRVPATPLEYSLWIAPICKGESYTLTAKRCVTSTNDSKK